MSILRKILEIYTDVAFAAKATDITPVQAIVLTICGAFIVCLPTAVCWALGALWKATH